MCTHSAAVSATHLLVVVGRRPRAPAFRFVSIKRPYRVALAMTLFHGSAGRSAAVSPLSSLEASPAAGAPDRVAAVAGRQQAGASASAEAGPSTAAVSALEPLHACASGDDAPTPDLPVISFWHLQHDAFAIAARRLQPLAAALQKRPQKVGGGLTPPRHG